MPASLSDRDIKFKFRSPLDDLAEENEADIYIDIRDTILLPAAQIKPEIAEIANLEEATRDAMRAKGWKAKWFNPKEAVQAARDEAAQRQEAEATMQQLAAAGQVAEQGGKGIDALMKAGMPQGGQPARAA
jgi:hypothetical protein